MEIKMDKVKYVSSPGTSSEKTVLNDVSFTINKNDIYAFIGDSSSGKSHLGLIIDSLIKPTNGTCTIDFDEKVKKVFHIRKKIGLVSNNPYNMFFCKTVKEEILLGIENFGYKKKSKEERLKDVCKLFNIEEEILNKNPLDLSLSDAKIITMACVFSFNPSLIILDDIEVGMSHSQIEELIRILLLIKTKYNKTIILMSKNTDFIYKISNNIFIMNKGTIIKEGNKEILEDEELLKSCNLKTPSLISFVHLANKNGSNIEVCNDIRDIVKQVYRDVR